jgi:hypothetical protein
MEHRIGRNDVCPGSYEGIQPLSEAFTAAPFAAIGQGLRLMQNDVVMERRRRTRRSTALTED